MPHTPNHKYYNIRPQPTQSFVPTPKAQIQIPTMGMSAGLKTPIFGSQIPTMISQGKLPAPSKPTTPSKNLGLSSDVAESIKYIAPKIGQFGAATARAIDPTGGAFRNFLRGERGMDVFDPQSLIGATAKAIDPTADMGGWQRAGTALQPVLNVLGKFTEAWDPLLATAAAPLAGSKKSFMLEGEQSFNQIHKKYREQGDSWLEASDKAWDELDLHEVNTPTGWVGSLPKWAETPANFLVKDIAPTIGYKGGIEMIDPFVLLPVGKGATAAGRRALGKSANVKKLAEDSIARQKYQPFKQTVEEQTKAWDELDAKIISSKDGRYIIGREKGAPLIINATDIPQRGTAEWTNWHIRIDNLLNEKNLTGSQHIDRQLSIFEDISKTTPESQLPPKPRDGLFDDAVEIGEELPSTVTPNPLTSTVGVKKGAAEKIVLRSLDPTRRPTNGRTVVGGLGKGDKLRNWVGGMLGDNKLPVIGRLGLPTASEARVAQYTKPITRKAEEISDNGADYAKVLRDRWNDKADGLFGDDLSRTEGVEVITSLIDKGGMPTGVAPTIADVAARLPLFWDELGKLGVKNNKGNQYQKFFTDLRDEFGVYDQDVKENNLISASRVDIIEQGNLADNIDRGFYIRREGGTRKQGDFDFDDAVLYDTSGNTINRFDFDAKFSSQAEGIGYVNPETGARVEYKGFAEGIKSHAQEVTNHISSTYRKEALENLRPNALKQNMTYKQYYADQVEKGVLSAALAKPLIELKNVRNLLRDIDRALGDPNGFKFLGIEESNEKLLRKLDNFLNDPMANPDEIRAILKEIRADVNKRLRIPIKDRALADQNTLSNWDALTETINTQRRQIMQKTNKLDQEYLSTMKKIEEQFRKELDNLPQLIEYNGIPKEGWIDDMGREIEKIILNDPILIPKKERFATIKAINGLTRGLGATLDFSANGITLLFGWARSPSAWARAFKANLQSLVDPKVLSKHMESFNTRLKKDTGLDLDTLVKNGLHISGGEFEFAIAQQGRGRVAGLSQKLENVRGIRNANRAFSNAGDVMRMEMTKKEVERLLRAGGNIQDIMNSGQLREITNVVNRVTGYSRKTFGGDYGELLLFAPRFFQTRIENLFNGIYGTAKRPFQTIGVNVTLEERLASQTLMSFIGYGTTLTFALNYALGNETDLNPFKEITTSKKVGDKTVFSKKWIFNPNFMTIRFQDRDWNLFGTQLATVRLFATIGSEAYQKDPKGVIKAGRGLSSPTVARAYDVISGTTFMGKDADLLNLKDKEYDPKTAMINLTEQFFPFAVQDMKLNVLEAKDKVQREGSAAGIATGAVSVFSDLAGAAQTPMSLGDLLQDVSVDTFGKNYYDIEPYEKAIIQELIKDKETPFNKEAKERITDADQYYSRLDEIKEKRWNKLEELGRDVAIGKSFVDKYYDIIASYGDEKGALEVEYNSDDINSPNPDKKLMAEYYALFDMAKTKAGNFDQNLYSILKENFLRKATKEQRDYIERNSNKNPVPPLVINKLMASSKGGMTTAQKLLRAQALRQIALKNKGLENLIPIADKNFYTYVKKEIKRD